MPNAFVSLVLVVLCAVAYMHFTQPPGTSPPPAQPSPPSWQSIIDEKVRSAGGTEAVRSLDLVSASGEPRNH